MNPIIRLLTKVIPILFILTQFCVINSNGQCVSGCNQSTTSNTMPGTNNFSDVFCITTGTTLTYNQNFDMNGGTTCIGPNVTFSPGGGNYNGNWTINNYGTTTRSISLNSGQTFNNYGTFTGSLTLNGGTVVNYNGASMTPSSFTFNNGSLTNNSGGTFTSSASITLNSGSTFINNGTLSLNGLTLNSSANATLGGTSTINGSISNNGNITVSGLLTVTSNFNQNSSGVTTSANGGQCNALNITGTIQGQGTYNGVNGLLLNKVLSPTCGSCMVNGATVVGAPANQINGATLTAAANNIGGTITNPGGSPAATHYIVLRRFGSAVTDQPTDYTTYAVGNAIGSSTVVAVNAISTLSFTDASAISLNGCGTYHYAVFPFNSNGTCGMYNRTINATNRSSVTVSSTGGTVGTSKTICSGNTSGALTLSAYVGNISRWEYAVSPFSSWTTIANTTNIYTSGALSQTTQFRAVINAGNGCSDVNSSAATITVNSIPTAPTGTGATRCGNGTVTLTATPGAGETIDWYAASSGGTALLSGNTSYTTSSLSSTTIYYAEARNTTTSCVSATRTPVTATVNPSPSVTLSNFSAICAGTTSTNLTYTSPVNSPDQYSIDWSTAANAAGLADVSWTTLSGGTIPVTGLISTAGAYAASILVRNSITGCTTDVSNGSVTTCGTAAENTSLTLTAAASGVFTAINFASYGTPTGSCGSFATSSCHAATSLTVVQNAALGNNSFTLTANNATFGDPCVGTGKRLSIEAVSTAQVLNIYAIPTVASVTGTSRCGTGSVTVNATASSGATIDWYAAASGGTALATGSTSYTTSISSTATWYAEARNTTAGCISTSRTAVTATVNSIPAAPTGTNNTRCGNGTVTLTATPASGETIDWYAASSGGTALATGSTTYTTGTISSTTTYYAEARNTTSGCVSVTRTAVTANVNPSPSVTLSNFTAICSGTTSTSLTYSSPVNSPDQYSIDWSNAANAAGIADVSWATLSGGTINISGLTTTAGNYSANIYVRNSTTGCQTDVSNGIATTCGTAAENTSLTLTAPGSGVFSAINFASYGTPTGSCGSFATSSCHSATSLSVVQNAALGNNSFTLGATNAIFGDPCSGTVKRLYIEALSSIQVLTINAAPTITATAGAARCDAGTLTLSATPSGGAATDWYAASSGGTALATGTSTFTTGSLSSTTTYYAGARNTTTGCLSLSRTAVTATINSYPMAPTAGNAARCGTGTVTINATPGTGETIDWYAAASGGTALVTGNTSYTTGSISSTTIYYAEARNSTTGCVSQARTAVSATVNSVPAAPAAGNAARCGTGTVTITATPAAGETIDWYAASSGGTALLTGNISYTTGSISSNTNYYATARNTTTGCVSATRTTVTATVNTVPAAPIAGNASRCGTGSVTLTATPASGVTVDWYAASSGGTALATGNTSFSTGPISSTTIYYAETRNSTSGCIATSRTAVTATINNNPAAPTGTNNTRCGTGSVTITATPATGETIDWYAASSGGTALATGNTTYTTGSISSTTTYYAEARNTTTGCISQSRTAVTATVNGAPSVTLSNFTAICSGTTSTSLTYSSPVNSPDQYSIDWSASANTAGISDVSWTTLSGGTISVTGLTTTAGSYAANIYVRNSSTGCQTDVSANSVVTCGTANEGGSVTLTAPSSGLFTAINFASYGTPNGSCGSFTTSSCHSATSLTVVQNAGLGRNSFTITANNATFGDPCVGTGKRLYIEAVSSAQILTINAAPTVTASTPATRCGTGSITISATPSSGAAIDWYAAASGGTALSTASNSYTTSLSSTTTFYAEARNTTTSCVSSARTAVTATVTLPTISSFTPVNAGPGMSVVITGTNFTGTSAVSFGGTAATSYTVNSATQITAVIASGSSGNVSVTTACGTSSLSGFTFYPAPTITSFTPTSGYIGNTITITGTNFTGATTVTFGGTTALSYTVVSSTTITAVINTGTTGSVAVTTPGGTATRTGFTYINATVWAGTINNSWSNSGNWNNGVPTSSSLVVIPPVETYPTLSSSLTIASLSMDTSTSLTIGSSYTLTVTGNLTSNGTITGAGSLALGGSSAQTISGISTVKNIIINNTAGASISSGTNRLSVTGTLTPTAGTLTTNGNLTLKSDASGTAMIAQGSSSGNYISGTVSWERYIPGRRSWRLISYPFTTTAAPTINASIQEGAGGNAASNPNPGYGTHITGGTTANGFDANPAGNPSMKEMSGSNWVGITSTSNPITSKPGYFIFVRGSRANNLSLGVNAPLDNTTLRGTGNIKQGNQSLTLSGSGWQLAGNPFPSPVNLNALATTNSAVINNNFKFWDPKLGGSNNVGGYVTVSYNGSSYDYAPTPASSVSEFLQSGAAFFVDAKSAGTLNINEAHKSSGGSDLVFRPTTSHAKLHINMKSVNSDGTKPVVDGVMVGYDENYDNAIDGLDATKLPSTMNENLSVKRDGALLSIERRNEIIAEDTIFLNLNYMRVRSYQLEIDGSSFDPNILSANLEDMETGTVTPIDLSGNTVYDFSITPTFNPNRLRVVFKRNNLVVLPVTLTSITATKENKNILVAWKVQNEINLAGYEIERSADGNNFTKVASQPANNTANAFYNWTDEHAYSGMNFYRIKMIDRNGQFKYSTVVYVSMNKQGVITVYPNPVTNNTVQLLMAGQEKGNYKLNVYNSNGQIVSNNEFSFNGTDATKVVRLNTVLPKGIYNAEVALPSGSKTTIQIAVQ